MAQDLDGWRKNLYKCQQDWNNIKQVWRVDNATQEGWTHQYMQRCRTACRVGPVLCAHVIGLGGPLLALIAIVGWWL